ncbi:Nn.00g097110.m01.CDS01 [Neocucurbitaria sp. VM-36]
MAGSHNEEDPSRSPCRATHEHNLDREDPSHMVIRGSPSSGSLRSTSTFCMPFPERNQYSNNESGKVNAGLDFGGGAFEGPVFEEPANMLATNVAAVNIDFSQLIIPIVPPEPRPSVEVLVQRLLHPPPHAFIHAVLSLQWVRGAVGQDHFDFRESDERYVLSRDSELREHGGQLSIPALYMEWLCGDNELVSSTEQSVYLTPEFFEEIRLEELDV